MIKTTTDRLWRAIAYRKWPVILFDKSHREAAMVTTFPSPDMRI
ncbi:hypothetical protein [Cupriavidus sp.]|jgi:hypothetical protein|nr:hypothetical protein [Cupriavidus sp.]